MKSMRANVFRGVNNFQIEEVEKPRAGIGDAVIRVTLTTICGTDLHIVRGEYPVLPGLTIGHEPDHLPVRSCERSWLIRSANSAFSF